MSAPTRLGKYQIRRELGKGAMGVVYEAWDPVIDRRVAIKVIRRDALDLAAGGDSQDGGELLTRLRREAQAAGRLSHAGIVAIYDFGEDATQGGGPVAYIAMELVDGRELRELLDDGQRFGPDDAVRIVGEMLAALQHAHERGVTHRDIKPANVILMHDGSVKLADFGVARIESSDLTQAGTLIGTPSYMSPEQLLGLPVDGRSDLFSCGVLLYEMLTGRKPFAGSMTTVIQKVLNEQPAPPSQANPALSPAWDAVLDRALAKKPEARFQNARAMADALRAALAAQRGDATVVRPADRAAAAGVAHPRRGPWIAGAGLALVGAVIAGVYVATRPDDRGVAASPPAPAASATVVAAAPASATAVPLPAEAVAAAAAVPAAAAASAAPPPAPASAAPSKPPPPLAASRGATAASRAAPPGARTAPVAAAPTPPSASTAAAAEWTRRAAQLQRSREATTMRAALTLLLEPLNGPDRNALAEFDAALLRRPPHTALVMGAKDGAAVFSWQANAASADEAVDAARRRCFTRHAVHCRPVFVDGELRRDTLAATFAEFHQPIADVRNSLLYYLSATTQAMRRDDVAIANAASAAAAAKAGAASAPAKSPPAPATGPATRPATGPATAPAARPAWERSIARLRALPASAGLAKALQALLQADAAEDLALLERLQATVLRLRWSTALAMGERNGYLTYYWPPQPESRADWAEQAALGQCKARSSGCVIVLVNGELRPGALAELAVRFDARAQAEVRGAFLRALKANLR